VKGYTVRGFGTTGKNTNQLGETGIAVETLDSYFPPHFPIRRPGLGWHFSPSLALLTVGANPTPLPACGIPTQTEPSRRLSNRPKVARESSGEAGKFRDADTRRNSTCLSALDLTGVGSKGPVS